MVEVKKTKKWVALDLSTDKNDSTPEYKTRSSGISLVPGLGLRAISGNTLLVSFDPVQPSSTPQLIVNLQPPSTPPLILNLRPRTHTHPKSLQSPCRLIYTRISAESSASSRQIPDILGFSRSWRWRNGCFFPLQILIEPATGT
jgi:hypothetical protein